MWDLIQFLTSGLLAVVSTGAPQVTQRSCSYGGVFHVEASSNYSLTFEQAGELCQSLYGILATEAQIREAYSKGLDTCRYGWIHDQRISMLHHGVRPECPYNGTGVVFLEDTPESLTDAYCYDPAVTSDVVCEESVTPPAKEPTAVTSGSGLANGSSIGKPTTDVFKEKDDVKTEITPDAVEAIPEVHDANDNTTGASEMAAPGGGDDATEDLEVAVEPTAGEPMTTNNEGEEETGEGKVEAKPSEDDEAFGANATTTGTNETTSQGDLEDTVAEDGDVQQVNGTEAVAGDADNEHENGTETVLEDAEEEQTNGTTANDVSANAPLDGPLEPSEAGASEGEEQEEEELGGPSPTTTASESDDVGQEDNTDGKEEGTTLSSLDSMAETTETLDDVNDDLKEEPSDNDDTSHDAPAPRSRMGRKNTQTKAKPTPSPREGNGAPGWLIIFSFVMVVTALICIFAAIATKDRWLGPRRRSSTQAKDGGENGEKRAAVLLNAEKEQEMASLMNKGQVQTNGRVDEFTVIALEEPPEKEFSA